MVVNVDVPLAPAAFAETKLNEVTAMSPATNGTCRRRIFVIRNMYTDLAAGKSRLGDAKAGLRQLLNSSLFILLKPW